MRKLTFYVDGGLEQYIDSLKEKHGLTDKQILLAAYSFYKYGIDNLENGRLIFSGDPEKRIINEISNLHRLLHLSTLDELLSE